MKATLFKTNIKKLKAAMTVANLIPMYFKGARVEFDGVQNKFKMLISGPKLKPARIINSMQDLGYKFEVDEKITVWKAN